MDSILADTPTNYPVTTGRRYVVSMDAVGTAATVNIFWVDPASGAIGVFLYENSDELLATGEGRGFEFVAPTSRIRVEATEAINFGLVELPA